MITLTIKSKGPSSPQAIDLAKKLLESKKQTQAEMREFARTDEFQTIVKRLREKKNAR
ncbi:hypothetical protein [Lacihabitans soyangensis]|jgi:hypothetical protein|uniref:hypothetical protein n=1 Tax=Lacihabitans soyangensis TaxID=869394 RepID=UPI0020CEF3D0|nr:hypothetical protein [Lacihabitans soyangensis]